MTEREARAADFEREHAAWLAIAEGLGAIGYEVNSMEETRQWVLDHLLPGYQKIPDPQWEYGMSWDKNYPVIVDEEQDEDRIRGEAEVYGRKLFRRLVGPWEATS